MTARGKARELLRNYIQNVFQQAKFTWEPEYDAELDRMMDALIDAAAEQVMSHKIFLKMATTMRDSAKAMVALTRKVQHLEAKAIVIAGGNISRPPQG